MVTPRHRWGKACGFCGLRLQLSAIGVRYRSPSLRILLGTRLRPPHRPSASAGGFLESQAASSYRFYITQ
jgi:hypothetical protein